MYLDSVFVELLLLVRENIYALIIMIKCKKQAPGYTITIKWVLLLNSRRSKLLIQLRWNIIKKRLFRIKHTIQARCVHFLSVEVEGHLAYLNKYKMISKQSEKSKVGKARRQSFTITLRSKTKVLQARITRILFCLNLYLRIFKTYITIFHFNILQCSWRDTILLLTANDKIEERDRVNI